MKHIQQSFYCGIYIAKASFQYIYIKLPICKAHVIKLLKLICILLFVIHIWLCLSLLCRYWRVRLWLWKLLKHLLIHRITHHRGKIRHLRLLLWLGLLLWLRLLFRLWLLLLCRLCLWRGLCLAASSEQRIKELRILEHLFNARHILNHLSHHWIIVDHLSCHLRIRKNLLSHLPYLWVLHHLLSHLWINSHPA